jgi:hypothetical protein
MPEAGFGGIFSRNAELFQLFEAEKGDKQKCFSHLHNGRKSGFPLIDSAPLPVCTFAFSLLTKLFMVPDLPLPVITEPIF